MVLSFIILALLIISVAFGALSGRLPLLTQAAISGAEDAVRLCISICGMICLWSGVMETMSRSGLAYHLSNLLRPFLKRLYPTASRDPETMNALSSNVSANLLGLGNAATPAGIKAALGISRLSGGGVATNELCLLVVMNTASIQLIPTTVASLRSSLGASAPFDILPAVWLTSAMSVTAGILAAKLFSHFSKP